MRFRTEFHPSNLYIHRLHGERMVKGSPIVKALTCKKIYLQTKMAYFLVKKTETSGFIV